MGLIRNGLCPDMVYVLDEDTAYFSAPTGEIISKSQADEMINALIQFYSNHDDEQIEFINYKRNKASEKEYKQWSKENKKKKAERSKEIHKGYVYILKCAYKYKIDFSNNVERRMQQLDTRPFPLEYIYSKYFDNAWYIEQWIHNDTDVMNDRVDGEWYKISDEHLQNIIDWLEELTDEQWVREENGEV